MKVYIIDDSTTTIMKTADFLITEGIDVRYSLHVSKNLWQDVDEYGPDVFIIDPLTRDKKGNIIADYIQDNDKYKEIPVINICNSLELKREIKTLQDGFNHYVERSVEKDDLLSKIKVLGGLREILKICDNLTKEY